MATRAQLLQQFAALDTATLDKLIKYANTLLIPDADCITKVTFADMVDKAHSLADQYFPEWTDRSQADFGEFLVELFALQSEKDFFYVNAFGQEGFLLKAKSYVNVYYNALKLGYIPQRSTAAQANFSLTFTGVPSPQTYVPGSFEIGVTGTDLVFTNVSDLAVPAGTNPVVTSLKSGKMSTTTVAFNGKSIRILGRDVDYRYVFVTINNDKWDQVDNFANSDNTSKVFMVLPTDGNDFEIIFGINGYGSRPQVGVNVTVNYLSSPVANLNVAAAPVSITRNVTNNYITAATMQTASTGGAKNEAIESIRQRASMLFRVRGAESIRTPNDAITILESMSDIRKATAFNFANMLYFAVIPADGNPATSPFMTTLENRIKGQVMMGFTATGSLTSYVTISEITVTAYIYSDFVVADVVQNIRDYFDFVTDPMSGANYGVGLDIGFAAEQLLESVQGLSQIVFNTVNSNPANDIVLSQLQIFNKINQSNLTINVQKVS